LVGWKASLWTLPVVWTAWEWLFHRTELSLGTIQLAYTQLVGRQTARSFADGFDRQHEQSAACAA
jgi:hypothetical protein